MSDSQPAMGTGDGDVLSSLAAYVSTENAPSDELPEEDAEQGQAESQEIENAETEEQPQEETQEPEKFTVKVNGQELEVSLDELIAGYQKDSDYRQKTAEVAEQRRQAEAVRQAAAQERAQAAQAIQQASMLLQSELGQYQDLNWQQLAMEDPAQYVALKAQFDAKAQQLQQLNWQQQQIAQIEEMHRQEHSRAYLSEQKQEILAKLPEWKNPEKAQAEISAITGYLKSAGLSDQEVDEINDHRAVLIARKAMLYDALMAKQPQAMQKVAQAPKRVESTGQGTRPADQRTAAMKQLNRTGNVKDAAPLMKAFLKGN